MYASNNNYKLSSHFVQSFAVILIGLQSSKLILGVFLDTPRA